jgi:RNA polymerase sigma factor (sigma-70 family)
VREVRSDPAQGQEWLAQRFEVERPRLTSVAFRMLGSQAEAEDVVQEAWLRLSASDAGRVDNLGGWLTTVTARICLDQLRSRRARREEAVAEAPESADPGPGPEQEVVLADSVGLALLVVLETLTPAERVSFVLHDVFDLPFEEVAKVVGRTPAASRQLASRARRRVRGAGAAREADLARRREVVEAFLAASRGGDLRALLALLDPEVVLRSDPSAVRMGSDPRVTGAREVAEVFAGRARVAEVAMLGEEVGLVWVHDGKPRVVFSFAVEGGLITGIEIVADPERIRRLNPVTAGR